MEHLQLHGSTNSILHVQLLNILIRCFHQWDLQGLWNTCEREEERLDDQGSGTVQSNQSSYLMVSQWHVFNLCNQNWWLQWPYNISGAFWYLLNKHPQKPNAKIMIMLLWNENMHWFAFVFVFFFIVFIMSITIMEQSWYVYRDHRNWAVTMVTGWV